MSAADQNYISATYHTYELVEPSLRGLLGQHNAYTIAQLLGLSTQLSCDSQAFLLYASLAGARFEFPFNVAICSPSASVDQILADDICAIVDATVAHVATLRDAHVLAKKDLDDVDIVFTRSGNPRLFRFTCETASRIARPNNRVPSVWTIGDDLPEVAYWGPTLPLAVDQNSRGLQDVGYRHASAQRSHSGYDAQRLRSLLNPLSRHERPGYHFRQELRAPLRPEEMLVVNRVMFTLAVLGARIQEHGESLQATKDVYCSIDDYALTRLVLCKLPVYSMASDISAPALETARILYFCTEGDPEYQKTVPDLSSIGCKAFDRLIARSLIRKKAGIVKSYNTIKSDFEKLEDLGIIESNVQLQHRKRGKHIWFRFATDYDPRDYVPANPYMQLPSAEKIAADCNRRLQS